MYHRCEIYTALVGNSRSLAMAAVSPVIFPAILLLSLLDLTSQDQQLNNHLLSQLHDSKLKIAQLESSLEEIISKIEARDIYLEKREKQIREMEERINSLQSIHSNLKIVSFAVDEKVTALEEEMQEIVSERWIQIQQFEQALQLREMAVLKAQRVRRTRCSFLKFMEDFSGNYLAKYLEPLDLYLFEKDSALRSFIFQTLHHFNLFLSRVKESHHELQGFIKREMERHELTAHLANEELVFVVASAVVIFPVLSAWLFLSSHLR